MSIADVAELLKAISDDAPCGEDLEYDESFGELERSAQYKAEQQFGDTVVEAEEPNWKQVQDKSLKLFSRTKDLRVAHWLTSAQIRNEGMLGLSASLSVVRGLLDQYWETVHPRLDADDDNDPTFRINSLAPFSESAEMIAGIRDIPLVSSRAMGKFSLRDISIAEGTSSAAADETPADINTVDAAFMDTNLDELQGTAEAVAQSIASTQAIESIMTDKVGSELAPDLSALRSELQQAQAILAERLSRRGVGVDVEEGDASGGGTGKAAQMPGVINCREDVVRMLDRACEYYNRHEPSSPVPLLLQRAKRLVSADFIEVMRELAPEGLTQAQRNAGVEAE